MIAERLCSTARLIIKKKDQKKSLSIIAFHVGKLDLPNCESKRAYVTLSLVGAVGVAVVLLQIS